ncbi:MAG: tyrosine-protein phosphatase [Planctomycetes bacterium]|nr:tyrosine-protein phosphatase [Planctomycetota bacterium]
MRTPPRFLLLGLLVPFAAACSGIYAVGADVVRAPQLPEDLLARTIEARGIRTLVCLRAESPASAPSARAAIGTEVTFLRVPMSANRLPEPATLLALWQIAATAERPLLVHCKAGVDRTGLASALFVLHDTGDLERARGELALIPFGHVAFTSTGAMDRVLELYAPHHAAGTAFPDWVRTVYAAGFRSDP